MVPVMSVKRELIKGTLILTAAGFAARLLGKFDIQCRTGALSADISDFYVLYGDQLCGDTGGRVENGGGLSRRRQEKGNQTDNKISWDHVADFGITEQRLYYCFF